MNDNLTRLDNALAALSVLRNEIMDVFPAPAECELNEIEGHAREIEAALLRARSALGPVSLRVVCSETV